MYGSSPKMMMLLCDDADDRESVSERMGRNERMSVPSSPPLLLSSQQKENQDSCCCWRGKILYREEREARGNTAHTGFRLNLRFIHFSMHRVKSKMRIRESLTKADRKMEQGLE